jgi:mannitol-1-/sugar-/sorbitol-6-phosphatase
VQRYDAAAFLFDMDGVLLDSTAVFERTWRRWAARHNRAVEPFLRAAHGRRTSDALRAIAPDLATAEEVAWLDAAELADFDGLVPVSGAADLVRSIPSGRWTVVTSSGRNLAVKRLAAVGLTLPETSVTGEEVARGKPAPEGYLLGAQRLGVRAAECLVVEDAPAGVQAGLSAGATVLGLTTTHGAEALAGAHLIVPDLRAVRATATASRMAVTIDVPGAAR